MIPIELLEIRHNLTDRDWDYFPTYTMDKNEADKVVNAIDKLRLRTRRTGRWFPTGAIGRNEHNQLLYECQCSLCRGLSYFRKETLTHGFIGAKFCDHCGADMRESD